MLTHLDKKGNAQIVDISNKTPSKRIAVATGKISISKNTEELIKIGQNKKGDIFTVAKVAGIMAAKNTSHLIPLCHPIQIEDISINFTINSGENFIQVETEVKCSDKTGVEIEALTAASVALLTIYDMCKANDKKMRIFDLHLIKKTGGKSNFNF